MIESVVLAAGLLLFTAFFLTQVAGRFGLPSLLFFLALGMLAGSEGFGGIAFDDPQLARNIGTVCLSVILFSGGLNSDWRSVRRVLVPGLLLASVGVVITTLVLGSFIKLVLGSYTSFNIGPAGLSWAESFLLAAIVSSTDAAAVFSLYRSSSTLLPQHLRTLLEFESGSNDPAAVLLTLALLQFMAHNGQSSLELLSYLGRQIGGGLAGGVAVGLVGAWVAGRRSAVSAFQPMLVLSVCLTTFGLTASLGGNGFLAVYIAGLTIGNRLTCGLDETIRFHNGLSWLMEVALFVMLGLLVFPSQLLPLAVVALAVALFLIILARPVAVFFCLLPLRYPTRQTTYLAWCGLRGSVPIVLATFPASYGIANAKQIFHVVFFIVLISIVIQGPSLVAAVKILNFKEK